MNKIGIICPSEIAFRRFLPALEKVEGANFYGIAVASYEEWFGNNINDNNTKVIENETVKATKFIKKFGGKLFSSYDSIINDPLVDSIYIPLPPSLHYKWAKLALEAGKHVFLEKPATDSLELTTTLIETAMNNKLALHENYMFVFHKQLSQIKKIIESKELGNIRIIRIAFGFPKLNDNNFRYNVDLGGGALLDCGGYTLKYATMLLGDSVRVLCATSNYSKDFYVDLYGSATLTNDENQIAQISFGMDNDYKCEIEIWGSKGTLFTDRVLTAPPGFTPKAILKKNGEIKNIELSEDDTFKKSIEYFIECINCEKLRQNSYSSILSQASLVEEFKNTRERGKKI
ncbi:MAG: Gfo/Idh/MocA family oxidoreductase [Erysipelotrichaceae bacterium]